MDALVEKIVTDGSFIDLILFMILACVAGCIFLQKLRVDKKEKQIASLLEKYNLLNNHTLIMSTVLSIATKRKLHKQEQGGEWSTVNPIIEEQSS